MLKLLKKIKKSSLAMATMGLLSLGASAFSAGPSGNFIVNVSTIPNTSAVNLTSATVRTQLNLPYLTAGQCLSIDSNKHITSQACSSGSSSTLAVTTGTSSSYSSVISSPTTVISFNNQLFTSQLIGGSTNFVGISPSSVTMQGNTFNGGSQLVQLTAGAALPAVSAANLTSIPSANLSGQVPAANLSNAVINQNTLQSGATFFVSSGSISGKLTIVQADTTNNPSALVITSTGTGIPVLIDVNGFPGAAVQNQQGGVTIRNNNINGPAVPLLVLVDSTTDVQSGVGVFELWSNNPLHNDPLMWIHRTSSNSSPEMRIDSPSPNFEVINTSTDTAIGLGKWEPFAMASTGVNLQVNSRAANNSTFERVAEWRPRSKGTGLAIYPTINGENGNTQSSTSGQLVFITTNTREVGIKAPTATSASWYWTLPETFNNLGNVLYQSTNSPDRKLAFTTDGTTGQVLKYNASAAPSWGDITAAGSTYSLQYKNSSGTLSGSGFFVDINQQQLSVGTTTGAEGAIALQEASANGSSYVAIRSSAALTGSTSWIWPAFDGSDGDVLTTHGGGAGGHVMEWIAAPGAPGGSTYSFQYKSGTTSLGGATKVAYDSATGGLALQTTGQLELFQGDNAHYVGFKSTDTGMSGSTIWVLPAADGTANQVMATAGAPSHALSFVDAALLKSTQTISGTHTFTQHIVTTGTVPSLSSCGTSPSVIGNDNAFTLTAGASATGCGVTFFTAASATVPTCTVSQQSMSLSNALTYVVTTSSITISQTGLGGNKLDVICSFHN